MKAAITIKQLRYFDELARTQHFGRAAANCAVTQPALSMQIKELETHMGAPLIERTSGGAILTPIGEEVARRGRSIIAEIEDIATLGQTAEGPLSGRMRLGIIPTVAPYILPTALSLCYEEYPSISVSIRESQTDVILRELAHGSLDAIVVAMPHGIDDLTGVELFDDPFVLALPAQNEDVDDGTSPLDQLAQNRMLLLEEGHCFRDQALDVCQRRPEGEIDVFGAASLGTVARMVESGMGVSLLPAISLDVEARNAALKLVRFDDPVPTRKIGLVWRKSSPRGEAFEALAKLLSKAGEEVKARYTIS